MSDQDAPCVAPPATVHFFAAYPAQDGGMICELFRRTDLHQLTFIGRMHITDKAIEAPVVAAAACAGLDAELKSRPKSTEPVEAS